MESVPQSFNATTLASQFAALSAGLLTAFTASLGGGEMPLGEIVLIAVFALFNWFLSPFSGAHRVYIAVACGLLFFLPRLNSPRSAAS